LKLSQSGPASQVGPKTLWEGKLSAKLHLLSQSMRIKFADMAEERRGSLDVRVIILLRLGYLV